MDALRLDLIGPDSVRNLGSPDERVTRAELPEIADPEALSAAIVRLAEAGWTDAQIQAMTNQSPTMVAYYRQLANRKRLTRRAHERNGNGTRR